MSPYSNDHSPRRRYDDDYRGPRKSREPVDDDDGYGRRRAPASSRTNDADVLKPPREKPTRRQAYDASDEDSPERRDASHGSRDTQRSRRPRMSPGQSPIPRPPIGSNGRADDYDGQAPRRRRATNAEEMEPPRRTKDAARDYARDEDPPRRRPPPKSRYYEDEGESEYEPRPRSNRHKDRDDPDRAYKSDVPRRRQRDDYERGYRTDGRDRDRDRDRERRGDRPPREDRRRDKPSSREQEKRSRDSNGRGERDRRDRDRDRDRDHRDRTRRSGGRRGDLKGMVEQGQKHWKTVEPVAKPLLGALAKAYLENGR